MGANKPKIFFKHRHLLGLVDDFTLTNLVFFSFASICADLRPAFRQK